MSQFLQLFILLPLITFFGSLLLPRKREKLISGTVIGTVALHLILLTAFIITWVLRGDGMLDRKHIVFFQSGDIEIFADFYFDRITAVFAFTGDLILLLTAVFSKFYLHREEGYKRYFTTLLLFFLGYNLVVFAGNFETLFMGWEILGICSFLLIAFYRDRYLPVKNGLKVISIYRFGDICLILTMWMSHQLWHENITFLKLADLQMVATHVEEHRWFAVFIALMIVLAAATKSAQLPFSSWLTRAMEGPTTSSAIFYGALSVHLGVFLLLRTYPYWQGMTIIKVSVIAIGISTAIMASLIARVQSTVKTQIAYASIAQMGLLFVEVALGLHLLALIHFAGNAFLRTYQLLVSPSMLSYRIHNMMFQPRPAPRIVGSNGWQRLSNSIYLFSLKEARLDQFHYRYLWAPFKWIGRQMDLMASRSSMLILVFIFLLGLYADQYPQFIPAALYRFLPVLYSFLGLMLILRAFTERRSAQRAWLLIIAAQFFITLSIALFHVHFTYVFVMIYLSGSLLSAIGGYYCLRQLKKTEGHLTLGRFQGHVYEHPRLGFFFLICCLGVIGFPFTPTFIGIDLIFSHIHKGHILLIGFTALSFVFMELAVMRLYARIFLGQHVKEYHPVAFRSS